MNRLLLCSVIPFPHVLPGYSLFLKNAYRSYHPHCRLGFRFRRAGCAKHICEVSGRQLDSRWV